MMGREHNVLATCMVALGDADAMITGLTRTFATSDERIRRVIDRRPGECAFRLTLLVARGRTVFIADTTIHEQPTPTELADIAVQTAARARQLGHEPRVALLSFSNFGNPPRETAARVREAVSILDSRAPGFEYDGEMSADMALNHEPRSQFYPFCRLLGPANVLIMPTLHSANVSAKLLQRLGGGTVIGPILMGLQQPVHIGQMGATVADIVNMAEIAAHDAIIQAEPQLRL
jgi:malate dehydrogenase (oxaloacetate-decarboxylating)(NADP+)